jgi:hypothetical protein
LPDCAGEADMTLLNPKCCCGIPDTAAWLTPSERNS